MQKLLKNYLNPSTLRHCKNACYMSGKLKMREEWESVTHPSPLLEEKQVSFFFVSFSFSSLFVQQRMLWLHSFFFCYFCGLDCLVVFFFCDFTRNVWWRSLFLLRNCAFFFWLILQEAWLSLCFCKIYLFYVFFFFYYRFWSDLRASLLEGIAYSSKKKLKYYF